MAGELSFKEKIRTLSLNGGKSRAPLAEERAGNQVFTEVRREDDGRTNGYAVEYTDNSERRDVHLMLDTPTIGGNAPSLG